MWLASAHYVSPHSRIFKPQATWCELADSSASRSPKERIEQHGVTHPDTPPVGFGVECAGRGIALQRYVCIARARLRFRERDHRSRAVGPQLISVYRISEQARTSLASGDMHAATHAIPPTL